MAMRWTDKTKYCGGGMTLVSEVSNNIRDRLVFWYQNPLKGVDTETDGESDYWQPGSETNLA
jgi:hypothetical protein